MVCRLTAGGNRIRTIGPALVKGLSAVADERWRTEEPSLTVRIRRRHTTAALSAVQAHRGTESSNPFPSSGESTSRAILPSHGEKPAFRAGVRARQVQRGQQRRVSRGAWRRQAGISLSGQIPVPRRR